MLKERGSRTWVEPFVGGANMIDKVDGKRIGADSNPYLIELLKVVRDNVYILPNHITEYQYKDIKNKMELNWLTGFVGFNSTFGARWFEGYARNKTKRNYTLEGKKNLIKQSPNLQGVEFIHSSYKDLDMPANSLIYCDPPYANTKKYKDSFNHEEFWQWCRDKTNEGHLVFISEYNAPNDFKCIKEVQTSTQLGLAGNQKKIEKLFVYDRGRKIY